MPFHCNDPVHFLFNATYLDHPDKTFRNSVNTNSAYYICNLCKYKIIKQLVVESKSKSVGHLFFTRKGHSQIFCTHRLVKMQTLYCYPEVCSGDTNSQDDQDNSCMKASPRLKNYSDKETLNSFHTLKPRIPNMQEYWIQELV